MGTMVVALIRLQTRDRFRMADSRYQTVDVGQVDKRLQRGIAQQQVIVHSAVQDRYPITTHQAESHLFRGAPRQGQPNKENVTSYCKAYDKEYENEMTVCAKCCKVALSLNHPNIPIIEKCTGISSSLEVNSISLGEIQVYIFIRKRPKSVPVELR